MRSFVTNPVICGGDHCIDEGPVTNVAGLVRGVDYEGVVALGVGRLRDDGRVLVGDYVVEILLSGTIKRIVDRVGVKVRIVDGHIESITKLSCLDAIREGRRGPVNDERDATHVPGVGRLVRYLDGHCVALLVPVTDIDILGEGIRGADPRQE
jgi:hypothetical protein